VRIYPRLQSLIASAMVLHGTIDSLIDFFSFTAWIFYGGAMLALIMDAYGPAPAFLFSWVSTLVLKPSQMAIICLSFAQYAVEAFVTECDPPRGVVKMVALVAIGKINILGITTIFV